MTATPLVNLAIGPFLGRKISRASIVALVLVLGGVTIARWGGEFNWIGFAWSAFGTIMNGILYELFSRAKATPLQKCFWGCIGTGVLGVVLSANTVWPSFRGDLKLTLSIVGFAFVGGFLYWISNLIAFENLPTTEASVLAQGETPAVILGAWLMLGERLTFVQVTGVAIALYGSWYLSRWLAKQNA